MILRVALAAAIVGAMGMAGGRGALWGQALPTASRATDVEVGAAFSLAGRGYFPQRFPGGVVWIDVDPRPRYGVEAAFREVGSTGPDQTRERTWQLGGRGIWPLGRWRPYGKAMAGVGTLEYPYSGPSLSYALFSGAGGVQMDLTPRVRLRAEYEYQHWSGFSPVGFDPQIVSVGAAWHFGGGRLPQ